MEQKSLEELRNLISMAKTPEELEYLTEEYRLAREKNPIIRAPESEETIKQKIEQYYNERIKNALEILTHKISIERDPEQLLDLTEKYKTLRSLLKSSKEKKEIIRLDKPIEDLDEDLETQRDINRNYLVPRNVLESKILEDYSHRAMYILEKFKFPEYGGLVSNKMIVFGSFALRLQPYYSDIDSIDTVHINDRGSKAIEFAEQFFQQVVKRFEKQKGWFITDIKCGMYDDGEPIKWTVEEVLNGRRNKYPDFNGHESNRIYLYDAISQVGNSRVLTKIDVSIPYQSKYLECTCIYFIDCNSGYINHDERIYDVNRILGDLKTDAEKTFHEHKLIKSMKRIFSQVKYLGDQKSAEKLYPLLTSHIAQISGIVSELKTLQLLVDEKHNLNINFSGQELDYIKERLSNIMDVELDKLKLDNYLNKLYVYLKDGKNKNFLVLIAKLINYLSDIVNKYTFAYVKQHNLSAILKKYGNINLDADVIGASIVDFSRQLDDDRLAEEKGIKQTQYEENKYNLTDAQLRYLKNMGY